MGEHCWHAEDGAGGWNSAQIKGRGKELKARDTGRVKSRKEGSEEVKKGKEEGTARAKGRGQGTQKGPRKKGPMARGCTQESR